MLTNFLGDNSDKGNNDLKRNSKHFSHLNLNHQKSLSLIQAKNLLIFLSA